MSAARHAPIIVEHVDRAPPAAVRRLGALGVATIHEAQERRGLLDSRMRPIAAGSRSAGSAVTCVVHPGDNLMLLAAVDLCQAGDLLVVATSTPVVTGVLGEVIATVLVARGVTGVVVDNGVRDVARLRALPLPIWSSGISAAGTTKTGAGAVNVPIVCAGAPVHPGDIIVADDDGVVVVTPGDAVMVATLGEERDRQEAAFLEHVANGESRVLSEDLHRRLEDMGIRRVKTLAALEAAG